MIFWIYFRIVFKLNYNYKQPGSNIDVNCDIININQYREESIVITVVESEIKISNQENSVSSFMDFRPLFNFGFLNFIWRAPDSNKRLGFLCLQEHNILTLLYKSGELEDCTRLSLEDYTRLYKRLYRLYSWKIIQHYTKAESWKRCVV